MPKEEKNKIFFLLIVIIAIFLSYYFVSKNNNKLPQTTNGDASDFSSHGSKIVFSKNGEIITTDFKGGNQIILVSNNGLSNWSPVWNPDGNKIAYISAKLSNPKAWQLTSHEIWIMDSDGDHKTKMFGDLKDKKNLSWSPDGSKIFFKASIKEVTQPEIYDFPYELWEINIDGSGLKQLTKVDEQTGEVIGN